MARVFWDTNLFIYLFEDYGQLSERVAEVRTRMRERGDELITSTLTLGEILVKPKEKSDAGLEKLYREVLTSQALVIPFDQEIAEHYAEIRCDRSIRAPDAIQLACAVKARVDLFLTNDRSLASKKVPGIHFIASLDRSPL